MENVKKRDYEGYLHCLVFPEHLVRHALAIKAAMSIEKNDTKFVYCFFLKKSEKTFSRMSCKAQLSKYSW